MLFFKKKKKQLIYLFTYLLNYLFLAALGLCCCSGCGVRASHFGGFSCFGAQALEHGLSSCGAGLVALRPVGSSQNRDGTCVSFFPEQGWSPCLLLPRTRMEPASPSSQNKDGTRVSCIGRWICNHWTTREALENALIKQWFCVGF